MQDESVSVRITAAEGLFNRGRYEKGLPVLVAALNHPGVAAQILENATMPRSTIHLCELVARSTRDGRVAWRQLEVPCQQAVLAGEGARRAVCTRWPKEHSYVSLLTWDCKMGKEMVLIMVRWLPCHLPSMQREEL